VTPVIDQKTNLYQQYYLGALVGCFLGGWAADRIGRINGLSVKATSISNLSLVADCLTLSWGPSPWRIGHRRSGERLVLQDFTHLIKIKS